MAVGIYGITRPADVNINDIDIYYNYTPSREVSNNTMLKLNPSEILSYNYLPTADQLVGSENLLEGLYNMRLPASVFKDLGIYTIYIKPKRVVATIYDCGVLSALPTVKGIVIDVNVLPEGMRSNNALQGYRIEYLDTTTKNKLRNICRYVVTSNRVVPNTENVGNTSQKAVRYRFDDSGSLLFLQLTPSSSSDVKPNALPFIGTANQMIIISNTFFSPLAIEIEMVENTIDTLSDIIAGEQIKDVNNGLLTYYGKDREITKQFKIYEIKDSVGDVPLFEVKEKNPNIDTSQDFNTIVSDVV